MAGLLAAQFAGAVLKVGLGWSFETRIFLRVCLRCIYRIYVVDSA